MHHPRHGELVKAISELHRYETNPFGIVVAEGLRSVGVPISDPEPREEIREDVAAAVELYCEVATGGDPFRDVLGPVFEEVSSERGRQMSGQFFTPWSVCQATVEMTLGDWKPGPPPDGGLWSVSEPACGSGALLLAFCAHLAREHGPQVLRMWSLHAVDLDLTLARTCALQLIVGLAATPAAIGSLEVWCGNTLSMEMRERVVRMRANPILDVLGLMATIERQWGEPPATPLDGEQFALFGEVEAA